MIFILKYSKCYNFAALQTEEIENRIKTENKEYKTNTNMNNQIVRLTESDLQKIIKESVTKILESINDEPTNTHYAVSKINGKILFSWDYSDIDPTELREFRKYYFTDDLIDFEIDPKKVSIWSRKVCIRKGINPSDDKNWANNLELSDSSLITESNDSYFTKELDLELTDIDFFSNKELEDLFSNEIIPLDDVKVEMKFEKIPYDPGDYWTEPSGGYFKLVDYDVDIDQKFKEMIPNELYTDFINDIYKYINKNIQKFEDDAYEDEKESNYHYEREI